MNTITAKRYTTAHTPPMHSGSSRRTRLLRSAPLMPARRKVGPSQRISAKAATKASPLNASDAISGEGSGSRKTLTSTATHAAVTVAKERASLRERVVGRPFDKGEEDRVEFDVEVMAVGAARFGAGRDDAWLVGKVIRRRGRSPRYSHRRTEASEH